MLRVSDYNIYVPVKNEKNEYLLLHGYTGAFDCVSEDVYIKLSESVENTKNLDSFSQNELDELRERGYITKKSSDEEIDDFKNVAKALLKKMDDNEYSVTLIPTYNCNFRCSYCYEKGNFKSGNELLKKTMDVEMVDNIFNALDESKKNGKGIVNEIFLFGGEPLLKQNLNIISYIVNKGMDKGYKFSAVTNGYDLDYYGDLLGKDKIERLQITLDGSEDSHNSRRFLAGGGQTYSKIVDNIDKCLNKDVDISIRTNMDESNIDEIEFLLELYNKKGWVDKSNFFYSFKSVEGNFLEKEIKLDDAILMERIKTISSVKDKFQLNSVYLSLRDFFDSILKNKSVALLKPAFCSAFNSMLNIDPFGDIYACWEVIGRKSDVIGTVDNGKFLFNDNESYWRNRNVVNMKECSKCAYALFCSGNCVAFQLGEGLDIYSPYCGDFKRIFKEVLADIYIKYDAI